MVSCRLFGGSRVTQKPRLLDQVRHAIRLKNYSYRTEKAYIHWIKRYIFFHDKRHPAELGAAEVEAFLVHLAVAGNVAASTQNQALSALLFLYNQVLDQPVKHIEVTWAKKPVRLPTVLTRDEVQAVMQQLTGVPLLVVQLLYGGGLRLIECLRLRVQDVDFGQKLLLVRDGKGQKDRTTTLPDSAVPTLKHHLQTVQKKHHRDLEQGYGRAPLPTALDRKYPQAEREWVWQFIFPSSKLSKNPRAEHDTPYRYHL